MLRMVPGAGILFSSRMVTELGAERAVVGDAGDDALLQEKMICIYFDLPVDAAPAIAGRKGHHSCASQSTNGVVM